VGVGRQGAVAICPAVASSIMDGGVSAFRSFKLLRRPMLPCISEPSLANTTCFRKAFACLGKIPVLPPAYDKSYKRYPYFSNRKPLFAAGCFSFGIPIRSARLHSSDMAELGSRLISELSKRRSG
jgi:hypothetical protein